MPVPSTFRAFVVEDVGGTVVREVRDVSLTAPAPGEVTIQVSWSAVNFKDGLASIANGKVARISPLVPGIDLSGVIVESSAPGLDPGSRVLVHGYETGVAHDGGYSEYASVPGDWVVPLPDELTERQAVSLGTAGFTAALSVQALEARGLKPVDGPVLVTGASGGVGSVAIGILAARGYEVSALTGKREAAAWLGKLGASEILDRSETVASNKPLKAERWAGAVDCVGGESLSYVLSTLRYGGAVAASGNTGGNQLATSMFPFILRGVALLGIDSVACPISQRRQLWRRLATDMRPQALDDLGTSEVTLDELPEALDRVLAGENVGRTLVRLPGTAEPTLS